MPIYKNETGQTEGDVADAIKAAQLFLNQPDTADFLSDVKKIVDFDYTSISGEQLVKEIITQKVFREMSIAISAYNDSTSKATAYFTPRQPRTIFLNTAKWKRSKESLTNTIVRETMHVFDQATDRYKFGNNGNDRTGKENTVAYKVGYLAYLHLKKSSGIATLRLTADLTRLPKEMDINAATPDANDPPNGCHLVRYFSFFINPNAGKFQLNITPWGYNTIPFQLSSIAEVTALYELLNTEQDVEIEKLSNTSINFKI